jgi:ubiquitin carboxyl-terminal hydrolase L3
MTTLLHNLGLSRSVSFHDVYSLTDDTLLSFLPRPAHALLLVFPVTPMYESHRVAEDSTQPSAPPGPSTTQPVTWYPQTIRNACGLIGLVHAASNGPARSLIGSGTELEKLVTAAEAATGPAERAKLLEESKALERAHSEAAQKGQSEAPAAEDKVDLHFVCFVKGRDGGLWELDGRRKGPIKRGDVPEGEDVLSPSQIDKGVGAFLKREEKAGDVRFSVLMLGPSLD